MSILNHIKRYLNFLAYGKPCDIEKDKSGTKVIGICWKKSKRESLNFREEGIKNNTI